ncbi:MAG: T9SS type A sorting domain-containing protein [Candidatus Kapabacteria bacterium]|nr:T9SS type A sorting domain-containing protein [Candidatus Kapabacteria bacterium]
MTSTSLHGSKAVLYCLLILFTTAVSAAAGGFTPNAGQSRLLASSQMRITRNAGQVNTTPEWQRDIRYYTRRGGMDVFFRTNAISYVVREQRQLLPTIGAQLTGAIPPAERICRFDVALRGAAASPQIITGRQFATALNFFSTNHEPLTGIESYESITYTDIYPNIDLRYRIADGTLKYEFVVHPGGDASRITLDVSGASVSLDAAGRLAMQTPLGAVIDDAPVSWWEDSSAPNTLQQHPNRIPVAVRFITSGNSIGFAVPAEAQGNRTLVIDPNIVWSSYFGGSGDDEASDLSLDAQGNLVVGGNSTSVNFPNTTGVLWKNLNDCTLSKFDAAMNLVWSTNFGGNDSDIITGIATDAVGTIYACGFSLSKEITFTGYQPNHKSSGRSQDGIVLKFNGATGAFIQGSFIGGDQEDVAYGITIDRNGFLTVVGRTKSADFPANTGNTVQIGDDDVFITRWRADNLSAYQWGTYFGGSDFDVAYGVANDEQNNIYLTGQTRSRNFPVSPGALQERINPSVGVADCFIAKLSASGSRIWSTYYGESGDDIGQSIVSVNGTVAVTGSTTSSALAMFGVTAQSNPGGLTDIFLITLDSDGKPKWSTYWGGGSADIGNCVTIGGDTSIVVTGYSSSTNFPLRRTVMGYTAGNDIAVVKFNKNGVVLWSSLTGGKDDESAYRHTVDAAGNIILCGQTTSTDFPVINPIQNHAINRGAGDYILMKMCPLLPSVTITPNTTELCFGGTLELKGDNGLTNFTWSNGAKTPRITITGTGKYHFTASDANGCSATSDTVTITIRPPINPVITTSRPTAFCEGDSVLLRSAARFAKYRWLDAQGNELGTAETITIRSAGTYRLEVEDTFGCKGTSASAISVTVTLRPVLKYKATISTGATIDSVPRIVTLCTGESLVLSPNYGSVRNVGWSNGSASTALTITRSDTLYAMIEDANGCIWRMDTVSILFQPKQALRITIPDSACVNSILDIRVNPVASAGVRYQWQLDGGIVLGTADSSSLRVRWLGRGRKSISVAVQGYSCTDTGRTSIEVQEALQEKILNASAFGLCTGESTRLTLPTGYARYVWNGVSGTNVFTITSPGTYTAEFGTGAGCTGYDTITVPQRMSIAVSSSRLQYDSIFIGTRQQRVFHIYNTSNEPVTLNRSLLDGRHYAVDSTQPAQQIIPPRDSMTLYVSFIPQNINDKFDTVRVRFLSPCSDSIFVVLQGYGKGVPPRPIMRFAINSFSITPFSRDVKFQLQGWLEPNVAQLSLDTLVVTLGYNPSMLMIKSVDSGTLELIPGDNTRAFAELRLPITQFTFAPAQIAELTADGLLGNRESDTIFVASAFVLPNAMTGMSASGGIVTLTELCTEGGTRLVDKISAFAMSIVPNPVTQYSTVSIMPNETGAVALRLYDVQGRSVWEHDRTAKAGEQFAMPLDASHLGAGVYSLVVQTPSSLRSTRIVVME